MKSQSVSTFKRQRRPTTYQIAGDPLVRLEAEHDPDDEHGAGEALDDGERLVPKEAVGETHDHDRRPAHDGVHRAHVDQLEAEEHQAEPDPAHQHHAGENDVDPVTVPQLAGGRIAREALGGEADPVVEGEEEEADALDQAAKAEDGGAGDLQDI